MNDIDPAINTFWDHLEDFRSTLIKVFLCVFSSFLFSLYFYKSLFFFLTSTLIKQEKLVLLGPVDGVSVVFKTCFWTGAIISSPAWLYCVFQFISPALKSAEKRLIAPFIVLSFLSLCLGLLFGYFITIPLSNAYLSAFNEGLGENLWSLSNYLDYSLFLLFANALTFEISFLFGIFVHFGVISATFLKEKRPYAIVSIFILAAILTPPDVMTQLVVALPLLALYELILLYAKIRSRN